MVATPLRRPWLPRLSGRDRAVSREVRRMRAIAAPPQPFVLLLGDFLDYLGTERRLSPNTLDAYRSDLLQLAAHLDRHGRDAVAVSAPQLELFMAELAVGATGHPPVSPATLQRKAACLRSFYRHLRRTGVIDHDPTGQLRGPPKAHRLPQVLNAEERMRTEGAMRRGKAEQRVVRRAQALLMMADGVPGTDIARLLGVHATTVQEWRRRFDCENPADKLADAPRSGRPPSLSRMRSQRE